MSESQKPFVDYRWRLLAKWVREREKTALDYVKRNAETERWIAQNEVTRAEVFRAVRLVMETETRIHRKAYQRWAREQAAKKRKALRG